MRVDITTAELERLRGMMKGELTYDFSTRLMYATDASIYREEPLAVAYPMDCDDIRQLLSFASSHGIGIIPRAAGTSLARLLCATLCAFTRGC